MMRSLVLVVAVVFFVGCGNAISIESRCEPMMEYSIAKVGDELRLYLEVGKITSRGGCRNGLQVRSADSVHLRLPVKSVDEAHKIINSELERYKNARPSEQVKLQSQQ